MASSSCFLFFLSIGAISCLDSLAPPGGDDDWCLGLEPNPYSLAVESVGSGNLTQVQFQKILDETLLRFPCYLKRIGSNDTCAQPLSASEIFQVLKLGSGSILDEPLFQRASAIVLSSLLRLSTDDCSSGNNGSNITWSALSEDDHLDYLLEIQDLHEHGHEDCGDHNGDKKCIGYGQLESLLDKLSTNYVSGTWKNPADVFRCGHEGLENTDIRDLNCNFGQTKSFSANSLWTLVAEAEHHDSNQTDAAAGVGKDQMGRLSSFIFVKLLSGHCIVEVEEGAASSDDFLKSIFKSFGDSATCRISKEGFQRLLDVVKAGVTQNVDSSEDPHSHDTHRKRKRRSTTQEHEQEHPQTDVSDSCLSMETLLKTFQINSTEISLSKADFLRLSPAVLQQASVGCQAKPEPTTAPPKTSTAQAYGYGTLAVAIVSACVVLALIIVRWKGSIIYRYLISTMLGLAVGSLAGDAMLHLLPEALGAHGDEGGHQHEHDGPITVEPYVWLSLCGCGSLWFYYNLQLFLYKADSIVRFFRKALCKSRSKALETQESSNEDISTIELGFAGPNYDETPADNCSTSASGHVNGVDKMSNCSKNKNKNKSSQEHEHLHDHGDDVIVHSHTSVAWMITIGDAIHNFADGLAMGAAFSTDWQTGIATTIAIFTHELPHEFGDTAVLLSAGWSTKKVLLFQLLSQATAFIGLYIGISVSETTDGAQQWIAAIASGMFLYIALADVIPELIQFFSVYSPILIFVTSNLGIAIGLLAMVLLAVYEERISLG